MQLAPPPAACSGSCSRSSSLSLTSTYPISHGPALASSVQVLVHHGELCRLKMGWSQLCVWLVVPVTNLLTPHLYLCLVWPLGTQPQLPAPVLFAAPQ